MMTPTAMERLPLEAKEVKTASFRPLLLAPFWAVPVLPAICTPGIAFLKAAAVPSGELTTLTIMFLISAATVALTGWLIAAGAA